MYKYTAAFHSKPIGREEDVNSKHRSLLQAFNKMPGPWNSDIEIHNDLPPFGVNISTGASLTKALRGKVSFAHVSYIIRNSLDDKCFNDDLLTMEFRTDKHDLYYFLINIAPLTCTAFNAYYFYFHEDRSVLDKTWPRRYTDIRHELDYIWPAQYFSTWLCERYFGKSPSQLRDLISDSVDYVESSSNGLYYVVSFDFGNMDLLLAKCKVVMSRLMRNNNE
jgi:hypothetical protein